MRITVDLNVEEDDDFDMPEAIEGELESLLACSIFTIESVSYSE